MKASKFPYEHYFYWLAFLVGLLLRLYRLGVVPLSDSEASWALQALGQAHGGAANIGAQPAYVLITSLLFSIIENSNTMARLLPALAGSVLIFVPFYFKHWMGDSIWLHRAGLVMAFGLAIDPGLVSISRQAGSLMPALAFTLLTLAALYNHRMSWAGFTAALALLSGPSLLQGLLILLISWGLLKVLGKKLSASQPEVEEFEQSKEPSPAWSVRQSLPAFALTLVLVGTLFLRAPQGLGGLADTLPAYFQTWITSSGIPVLRIPASLAFYQPLVLIFAAFAFFRNLFRQQDETQVQPVVLGLGVWAVVAFLLPFLYTGRQVGDLAWCLIPLWALASLEIGRSLLPETDKTIRVVAACLAALLFVMAVVGWLNLLSLLRFQTNIALYWASIIAAFLLGLIAVLLVAAGWSKSYGMHVAIGSPNTGVPGMVGSPSAAMRGLVGSLIVLLVLQLLSTGIGMTIVRGNGAQDLWPQLPTTGQSNLLVTTLTDLSSWNTGLRDQLEIAVVNGTPSLQWALRNFPNARFETALSVTESPPVVITPKDNKAPVLAEKYRGQDFVWSLSPGWQGAVPTDFLNWLAYRSSPLTQTQIILWARADAFPGVTLENAGASNGTGIINP